jgi:hypothetical protein
MLSKELQAGTNAGLCKNNDWAFVCPNFAKRNVARSFFVHLIKNKVNKK